jgi:saccharopine dehydrogenase-like NADP-dependent oxidoreductase
MASNNGARYLKKGKIVEIPTENLFKHPLRVDFPEVGLLEVYPNRDSLPYIDLYGLPGIETMYRGTFRFPHWCESLDALKALGLTSPQPEMEPFHGKSYREYLQEKCKADGDDIRLCIAGQLNLPVDSPAIQAIEWLGYFSDEKIPLEAGSPFDLTSGLMMNKMMLEPGARDMVVMLHAFQVERADGQKEVIRAHMLDFATEEDTSIARTVALPAAIATRMILEGSIGDTGVHIPVAKTIYEPVLDELEQLGIEMVEEWGLDDLLIC